MRSGGAQQCAQRSQPAQSVFWGVRAWLRSPSALLLRRASVPRVGGILGASTLQPVFDSPYAALCASVVPRSAKSASALGLAPFFT